MIDKESFINEQLVNRGIKDPRVIGAFRKVPREKFVPRNLKDRAYDDCPLPIGYGQTISQPYTVAFMTQILIPGENDVVFEVGTGSGYQAAILSQLVLKVRTIEIIPELARSAAERLKSLGIRNVEVTTGDGSQRIKDEGPFDGIIVTAGAGSIPDEFKNGLKDGGRLVIPVGEGHVKTMKRIKRVKGNFEEESFGNFTFVPLVAS